MVLISGELIVKCQECNNKCTILQYDVFTITTIKLRHDPEEEGRNIMEL